MHVGQLGIADEIDEGYLGFNKILIARGQSRNTFGASCWLVSTDSVRESCGNATPHSPAIKPAARINVQTVLRREYLFPNVK
jgi:hypothetical protein